MNQYFLLILLLLFSRVPASAEGSETYIIIQPHIGENYTSVTQTYHLREEGLTHFEVLTLSLSYGGIKVFDEAGDLDFEINDNVIIGKNVYRQVTVFFRQPTKGDSTFTVEYWFLTYSTGKAVAGKYTYRIANLTDSTVVQFVVPLTNISETKEASPTPVREEKENSTVFSYHIFEDTTIVLAYEVKDMDYKDTDTETFVYKNYVFEVNYPRKAGVLLEDIRFFINSMFPVFLEETGDVLDFRKITLELTKEEDTWAGAEYSGRGNIHIFINNTATYPSHFLTHELIHACIGDFPRYLEEGMATYFEARVSDPFAPELPETFIPSRESFFQTYERQFNEVVDITQSRYGLALTDHQEALIYAKYSKGASAIYEIAYSCGHETVREMLAALSEKEDADLNWVIYRVAEGEKVFRILKNYGFHVVPPYAYPAESLLEEVKQSWWGFLVCSFYRYEERIESAAPGEIPGIKEEIRATKEMVSRTVVVADGAVIIILLSVGILTVRKGYRAYKKNSGVLINLYLPPVVGAFLVLGYFLYEFLFHGYKLEWILRNILFPWVWGILAGVLVILLLGTLKYQKIRITIDVVWSLAFFVILILSIHFSLLLAITVSLGYVTSLLVLFRIRRKHSGMSL